MRCSQCQAEVTAGRFCLACGQPLAAPAAPPAEGETPRRPVWLLLLLALPLVALALFGAARLWSGPSVVATAQPEAAAGAPLLVAPEPDPLAAPPLPAAPTPPPSPEPQQAVMPEEVRAYLERLQRVDQQRQAADSVSADRLLEVVASYYGTLGSMDFDALERFVAEELPKAFLEATTAAAEVEREFRTAVPPVPEPCRALHEEYARALDAWLAAMHEVAEGANQGSLDGALGALGPGQQGYHGGLTRANEALEALCRQYGAAPPFQIRPTASSGLRGILGGIGG